MVFTTAYDGYALDAFAVNSVDYLLYAEEKMTFAVSEGKAYGVDHTIAQIGLNARLKDVQGTTVGRDRARESKARLDL